MCHSLLLKAIATSRFIVLRKKQAPGYGLDPMKIRVEREKLKKFTKPEGVLLTFGCVRKIGGGGWGALSKLGLSKMGCPKRVGDHSF